MTVLVQYGDRMHQIAVTGELATTVCKAFEEQAAIMEFDGGLLRKDAKRFVRKTRFDGGWKWVMPSKNAGPR